MTSRSADTGTAHQIELIISRVEWLSVLPSVAAGFLSRLCEGQFSTSDLAQMAESDPALAVRFLCLMDQEGIDFWGGGQSFSSVFERLPADIIRDGFFSVDISEVSAEQSETILSREELVLHSIAVGCCAAEIAKALSIGVDSQSAYFAGLLHDVGKLALEQVMPKSFMRIADEGRRLSSGICDIERKYLGIDHTVLGKRLGQKWRLPKEIVLAIWLHHNQMSVISQEMPEAKIAQIVQLADMIARDSGIGQSGSFDSFDLPSKAGQLGGFDVELIEQIESSLLEQVEQKAGVLGIDLDKRRSACWKVFQDTAVKLARKNAKFSMENERLHSASAHFDFITDFLSSLDSSTSPIEAAERFAVRWQRFYQTGTVCLYLADGLDSETVEGVVVEAASKTKTILLDVPADARIVPEVVSHSFAILNVDEEMDWLFEQLEVEFERSSMKLIPLLSANKAVGAIVFEWRCPANMDELLEKFKAAVSIAGSVFDGALGRRVQERFAERFAELISEDGRQPAPIKAEDWPAGLAETAAGAAHELNNPLVIISGRTQLLKDTESDPEKKQILEQIEENANEASEIVSELLGFAKPHIPRPSITALGQIIDEAVELAEVKNGGQLDIKVDNSKAGEVFVDSAQITSAAANIISNALESYGQGGGQIEISAEPVAGEFVKLSVKDFGCGMDEQMVSKATYPFFSARSAGRGRGMGLAYARRLIELNNGKLDIRSQPGEGTIVNISLPCKARGT